MLATLPAFSVNRTEHKQGLHRSKMGYDDTPTRDGERPRRRHRSSDEEERRERIRDRENGRHTDEVAARRGEVTKKAEDEGSPPRRERNRDRESRRRQSSSDEEDESPRRDRTGDREDRRRHRSPDEEDRSPRRERTTDKENRRREDILRRERDRDRDSQRRHRSSDEEGRSPRRERHRDRDSRRRHRSSDEEDRSPRRKRDRDRDSRRRHRSSDEEDRSPRRERTRERDSRLRNRFSDEEDRSPRRERTRERESRHRNRSLDEEDRRERRGKENERRHGDEEGNQRGEVTKKGENQVKPLPMPDPMAKRTGGIYVPPFKLARMMREVEDKSSEAYQRLSWDALRKSINGLVNKVNGTNIKNIIPELFSENLIRGRGLFCRSCMKSQMASPGFTDVFAALVAVVNTKFPEVGRLLVVRIVLQLKRAYKRNDKPQLLAATKFIAHLVNQLVAHEVIALELLTVLLENPTDDSVEVAVGFVKECGALLQDISPQGLHGIFERFRGILHEGEIDKRVQFLIEGLFAIRKAKFQGFPAIRPELDLVEQEDQFTHEVSLADDDIDPETNLDIFKPNPNFLEDEKAYENLKKNILGAESSEDEEGSEAGSDDEDEEESEEEDDEEMEIKDETETNLVNLRRTIYLTIMSSVDFEEAGHKLLKIKLEPGQEMELCIMLLECCSQERTYLRYYGLLGQRFCMINKVYQENFEECFRNQYSMIHRLETNKLRNVAKFFAHLLATNALSWHVLAYMHLTEEDTTSSSRIFIKILFQELSEHLGIRLLNETLNNPDMQESFENIFPKDNPKNTRFSINFFTSIGLGGITESLREYLKNMPRLIMQQQKPIAESDDESGSSSGSSSESGSESDSEPQSESSLDESYKKKRDTKRRKRD